MEMMVVVVIIGVVLAIALPKFRRLSDGRQAAAAADIFVRDHELARVTAVRFGRDAWLHIDTTHDAFWADVDTSGSGVRARIGDKFSFSPSVLKIGSTDTLLCFDMRGLRSTRGNCQPGSATLAFKSPTKTDTILITPLGKVLR